VAALAALAPHGFSSWVLAREDLPWDRAFSSARTLIYLSADATEVLDETVVLDSSTTLVIGGLVDHKPKPGAAQRVGDAAGVRTAALPLDRFVTIRKPALTCLAVVQILLGYHQHRDWGRAVREAPSMHCAPLKKYVRWKHDGPMHPELPEMRH